MCDVSVLLPVYNAGAPLALAIRSILRQTRKDFEFLIIDDCSTDQSKDVIRALEKSDSRIRAVFHKTNQGLARTLNEGLHLAAGEYVIRMDQDDEALPQRIEEQVDYLEARREVAVVGSYVYHMGATPQFDRLVTLPVSHDEIAATLPIYNCMYHPSVALRRRAILDLGGYRGDFKNAEDYDLWLRVSRTYKMSNLPVPLLRYRLSLSGMTLSRKWEQNYFVQLAQVAHERPHVELWALSPAANAKLEAINRQEFMKTVCDGTIRELVNLGHWREALILAKNSIREFGWKSTVAHFRHITERWVRAHRKNWLQFLNVGAIEN
jgi:glycosyltransferase involved in cell wall biosynthesis